LKTVVFFNNKGGVGKTSLVYHLSWMFAERGISTLAIDLDPQANLTSMFLKEQRIEQIWSERPRSTMFGSIEPLMKRTGDISRPGVERLTSKLALVAGDLELSRFEDLLSREWPEAGDGKESAFRTLSAFHRIMLLAAESVEAKIVLMDVGPNLGAINRTALLSAEYMVVPLAPDLFSIQGLRNLGPTVREWRRDWATRLQKVPSELEIPLPSGSISPMGYVVMQHGIRDSRPVVAYQRWMDRIPEVYRSAVLGESGLNAPGISQDPDRLALLKHYRSLMPMAMEAHKPIFLLKPSDGAIGAHTDAVRSCYSDFFELAKRMNGRLQLGTL
jgi:chromosome partitioning protein